MRTLVAAPLLLALPFVSAVSAQEVQEVETPRGAKVEVMAQFPRGADSERAPLPALIIAPGQGYHMRLPLIKGLAEEALGAGFAVIRFDWHYYTSEGRPSPEAVEEQEDLEAVLKFAREQEQVDKARIFLAGKSLGTLVSYAVFRRQPDLKGLMLLTPVVSWSWDEAGEELAQPRSVADENYPGLEEEQRPLVVTVGQSDRLCSLPHLYAFLGKAGRSNVAAVIVPGDHGLNLGDYRDPAFAEPNAQNLAAAIHTNVQWLRVLSER